MSAVRYLQALMLLVALFAPSASWAVEPGEMLSNPALEARARALSKDLRCMVCQNESIDDSGAPLAHDLRVLVRDRIKAGDSNNQAIAYVHARYGDFVLLRPPLQFDTLLLWGGPLIVLLAGGFVVWRFCRRRAALPAMAPLSADERRRLDAVLEQASES